MRGGPCFIESVFFKSIFKVFHCLASHKLMANREFFPMNILGKNDFHHGDSHELHPSHSCAFFLVNTTTPPPPHATLNPAIDCWQSHCHLPTLPIKTQPFVTPHLANNNVHPHSPLSLSPITTT